MAQATAPPVMEKARTIMAAVISVVAVVATLENVIPAMAVDINKSVNWIYT